jgi:hypothetical protein
MAGPLVRLLIVVVGMVALFAAYLAMPLWAAHQIRAAARAGDVAVLERKVDWPSVRNSLKDSFRDMSQGEATSGVRRTMWQRIKSAAAPTITDRLVDRYATPQGVIQLARSKDTLATLARSVGIKPRKEEPQIRVLAADAGAAPPVPTPAFLRLVSRLKRFTVHSPLEIEFEVADRDEPRRSFLSTMRLVGFEWKLVEVRIVGHGINL